MLKFQQKIIKKTVQGLLRRLLFAEIKTFRLQTIILFFRAEWLESLAEEKMTTPEFEKMALEIWQRRAHVELLEFLATDENAAMPKKRKRS